MTPYGRGGRADYVAALFGRIALRYDLMNSLMSAGRHHAWRRTCLEMAAGEMATPASQGTGIAGDGTGVGLDVAAGTCDFPLTALDLRETGGPIAGRIPEWWVAADFSGPMLRVGMGKIRDAGRAGCIETMLTDAHCLPLRSGTFSLVTVGFGLRNFDDCRAGLVELARVLAPGGRLAVLEIFSAAESGLIGRTFGAAFRVAAPALGRLIAGDREAYAYLPRSAAGFTVGGLKEHINAAGLTLVASRALALGSVSILIAEKPRPPGIEDTGGAGGRSAGAQHGKQDHLPDRPVA